MVSISVVTPWYGKTHDLIPAYAAATAGAQVIAIDNGTPPETAAALGEAATQHGWQYIRNEENRGFAGGNNQGYTQATGDIVVFMNSDIAAHPHFLDAVAYDVKPGAFYGPSLQHQLLYGMWLPYLEGWCIAATRATWERVNYWPVPAAWNDGPWNAAAFPGPYWEDNELCLRGMLARCQLIHTAWPIQHLGGRSAGALLRWGETFERNRATFAECVRPIWEAKAQEEGMR